MNTKLYIDPDTQSLYDAKILKYIYLLRVETDCELKIQPPTVNLRPSVIKRD